MFLPFCSDFKMNPRVLYDLVPVYMTIVLSCFWDIDYHYFPTMSIGL